MEKYKSVAQVFGGQASLPGKLAKMRKDLDDIDARNAQNPAPAVPKQDAPVDRSRCRTPEERRAVIERTYTPRIAEKLDRVRWTAGQKAVMHKILEEHRSGVIIGGNGTGKTLMLSQCGLEMYARGDEPVLYVRAGQLFEKLRALVAGDESTEEYMEAHWVKPAVMFIDEVDKALGTQFEFLHFYELIDRRYELMKQTVIAGNFKDWTACAEKVGQSVLDRLADSEDGFRAEMSGRSFRGGF